MEGGVRRSAAQQQQTGTQATRKAASSTDSRKKKPDKVRAKRCRSGRWRGVFQWNFDVFEASFSGCKQNPQSENFTERFGGEGGRGNIIVKLFLKFCKSRRGFHTTAREPKRAHLSVPALETPPKLHEMTPRERENERVWEVGEGKKGEFWAVRRRRGVPKGGAPRVADVVF